MICIGGFILLGNYYMTEFDLQMLAIKNFVDIGDDLDDICKDYGIEIESLCSEAPKMMHWIFGWRWTVNGKNPRFCSGGITKREVVTYLIEHSKSSAIKKILNQQCY